MNDAASMMCLAPEPRHLLSCCQGRLDCARHVTGCYITRKTRICNNMNDSSHPTCCQKSLRCSWLISEVIA